MSGKILRVTEDFLDDFIEREFNNISGFDAEYNLIEELGEVKAI